MAIADALRGKGRMLVFGDSYSAGAVDLHGNTDGPVLDVDKRWWHYVAEALGYEDVRCYASNGAGFYGVGEHNTFADQLDIAGPDEQATLVMLPGGRNDGHPGSNSGDVCELFGDWLDRAAELYPNAVILVIPFMWDCGMWRMNAEQRRNYAIMLDVAHRFKEPQRLLLIENAWTWGWGHPDTYGCFLHPNNDGHRQFASHVISALFGQNGTQTQRWNRDVDTDDFTGRTSFTFADGRIAWAGEVKARREVIIGAHSALVAFETAAFPAADLPGARTLALFGGHGAGAVSVEIEPQEDITGNPDANPRKNVSHVVLRNTTDEAFAVGRGERVSFDTGFKAFMTVE